MTVCTLFILVSLAVIALGIAALCAHRQERCARFTEKLEFRDDERLTENDLP